MIKGLNLGLGPQLDKLEAAWKKRDEVAIKTNAASALKIAEADKTTVDKSAKAKTYPSDEELWLSSIICVWIESLDEKHGSAAADSAGRAFSKIS